MEYPEYKQDFDTHFAQPLRGIGLEAAESPEGQMLMIGPFGAVIASMDNYEFQTMIRVPNIDRPVLVWDLARYLLPDEGIVWGGFKTHLDLSERENVIKMMQTQARWIAGVIKPVMQGDTSLLEGYQNYIEKRAHYYKILDTQLPKEHPLRNAFTEPDYLEQAEKYFRENGIK